MKDLNKMQQLSLFSAQAMLDVVTMRHDIAANNVTVKIDESRHYPQYGIESSLCFVIGLDNQLVYAVDVKLETLEYFVKRAISLSKHF